MYSTVHIVQYNNNNNKRLDRIVVYPIPGKSRLIRFGSTFLLRFLLLLVDIDTKRNQSIFQFLSGCHNPAFDQVIHGQIQTVF